jgi:hypothetical protein
MSLKTRKLISVAAQLLLLAILATGTFASATPVQGTLNIGGTSVVDLFSIDFVPPPASGNGQIVILPGGNTGDFAFLNAGFNFGELVDRDPSQVAETPLSIPDWLTVPNFSFTLELIRAGQFSSTACFDPPANQQNCTPEFDPPGPTPPIRSIYNLTNVIDATGNVSAKASFFVSGTVVNTLDPSDTGFFEGEFTATILNRSYQDVIADLLAGVPLDPIPFSATFTVTQVPEPSSIALALGGVALLGAGLLRRRK